MENPTGLWSPMHDSHETLIQIAPDLQLHPDHTEKSWDETNPTDATSIYEGELCVKV